MRHFYTGLLRKLSTLRVRRALAALAIAVASAPASADLLVFNSIAASQPFYSGAGTGIPAGFESANFFVPNQTVELTRVLLPLSLANGSGSSLAVSLYSSDGTAPSGTAFAAGILSYSASGLSEVTFSPGTVLQAGSTYWLGVASGLGTTVTWNDAIPTAVVSEPYRNTLGSGTWTANTGDQGAFAVYGVTPVPLPAAGWLFLTGAGGLGAFLRRRRPGSSEPAFRVSAAPLTGVAQ